MPSSPPLLQKPTNADPGSTAWSILDSVTRLRYFGTTATIALDSADRWVLGSSEECSIRLDDPSGRVSRRHATLERRGDAWTMEDLDSTNGIRQNRDTRRVFQLSPGDEIELGRITLIAESQFSIELHGLLQRLIGWSNARLDDVDHALRAVREMAHLRTVLILHGDGAMDGVLRRLHRATLDDRPFVMLGANESGESGLKRATNGMLCIDAARLPRDLGLVLAGLRLPDARVRPPCARVVVA